MLETRITIVRQHTGIGRRHADGGYVCEPLKGIRFQKREPFFYDMDAYLKFWCAYPEIWSSSRQNLPSLDKP